MAINDTLFKAILAMDSYNRGYGEGVRLTGTQIGSALISIDSSVLINDASGSFQDEPAGFYARAYKYNGYTIISYRGTDQLFDDPKMGIGGDIDNGWGIGAGSPFGPQANLGIAFYKAVVGTGGNHLLNNIIVTGHSLGGGLAGFVGGLYGKNGTVFDSMAYQDAANRAHDIYGSINPSDQALVLQALALKNHIYGTSAPWDVNYAGIKAIHMDDEILENNRWFGYTGAQTPYFLESDVTLSGSNRHKIDTLIIVMFGKDSVAGQDWTKTEKYFIPALYDNNIAINSGADTVIGTMLAENDYAGIMRTALAYSAIDNGTSDTTARPFGDTGIRALFNDANEWGKVLAANPAPSLINDLAGSVSNIFTQFAGKLAIDKVLQSNSPTAVDGVLKLSGNGLDIDFGNKLWGTTSSIAGRTELFTAIFTGGHAADTKNVDSTMQALWGSSSKGIFEDVILATGSSVSFTDTPATGKANLFVGSLGPDSITASSGKDLLLGNFGIDSLSGGAGKDILAGGRSNDVLIGGADPDRFVINNGDGWDRVGDRQQGDRIVFNGTTLEGTATYQGNGVYSLLGYKLWQSGYSLLITSSDGKTTMEVKEFFTTSNGVWFDTTNIGITVPGTYQSSGVPKTYTGTEQDDFLNIVGGPNIINGLGGKDKIYVYSYSSTIDGGSGNDYISGSSVTDTLNGGLDDDVILSNGGFDTISGGGGNDRIYSGVGAQKISGGTGFDIVDYASSAAGVEVNLALTARQEGGTYSYAYGDILSDIEAVSGSIFADTIIGNSVSNTLIGGHGADILTGGAAADVFQYNKTNSSGSDSGITTASRDVITDFVNGVDKINLFDFDGTFAFRGTGAFTGTAHEVNYAKVAGNTLIGLDIDGNKTLDVQIQLLGLHTMTVTDFVL